MNSRSSLSGNWTGVYDYPDQYDGLQLDPVPFNVHINEIDGEITGEMDEPNTLAQSGMSLLFARIEGTRNGDAVYFIKTYERQPEVGHEVSYQGTLNEDCTIIQGSWTTIEGPDSWSGPFVMNRSSGKSEVKSVERREELLIRK